MERNAGFYLACMARVEAVSKSATDSIRREAERVVGQPFHGCIWHNASLAYEAGTPWPEFGRDAYKAYRRFQFRTDDLYAKTKRLESAFYGRYLALTNAKNAAQASR